MKALFIGRFQPFHLGHLSIVQKALQGNEHLYIGIGSSDASYRPANPMTCGERIEMIEVALEEAQIPREKFSILPIPNISDYSLWAQHVENSIPPFQKLYTGSETVLQLFTDYNNKLKEPYDLIPIQKEIKISATEIRDKMLRNRKWQQFTSDRIASLLEKWQIPMRLASVQESER